jgi:acetyl esterase/lipase
MRMTIANDTPGFVEAVTPEVLAETRAFNVALEALLATAPSVDKLPLDVVRRARREGRGPFPPPVFLPSARDVMIPGRGGEVRLRVIAPPGPSKGAYLHMHGGGWTLGDADMQDPALLGLATATGLTAISVGYRLAPEHPYPAGADDCEDAARWLLDRGARELGVPTDRLTLGGESAGAHLAALTLLRLRDRHGVRGAFRAANLVFGAFDMSMTPSSRLWGDRNLVLSDAIIRFFGDCFLPGVDLEARRAPDVSPLYADLRDLPPAIFTVGTLDPLLDDSLFMAARWRAAGARTELRVWPDAIHGFTGFPLAMARAATAAQLAFLSAAVD